MPRSDLDLVCASVRDCIDELCTILEILESVGNRQHSATRAAYKRLVKQLTMRQSELEERFQQLREEDPSLAAMDSDEIEAAWRQLDKSARVISKELDERVGDVRGFHDSKGNDTPHER